MQEIMMMLQRMLDFFSPKEKKIAFERLQYLDKIIPLITLEKEKHSFENEKENIRNKIYNGNPIKEITASIDKLSSDIKRYIRIQNDEDYNRIIQHLVEKNIKKETEIVEICDMNDRNIVFKYFQSGEHAIFTRMHENIKNKIKTLEETMQTIESIISQKEDVEELRFTWNNIVDEEKNKLDSIKKRTDNLENNRKNSTDSLDQEISSLNKKFICLEKYAKDYLSEESLDLFTCEVKDYMPKRGDITYYDIFNGMADCIVTELKGCIGRDIEGKSIEIKNRMAKMIYARLKKEMFVI